MRIIKENLVWISLYPPVLWCGRKTKSLFLSVWTTFYALFKHDQLCKIVYKYNNSHNILYYCIFLYIIIALHAVVFLRTPAMGCQVDHKECSLHQPTCRHLPSEINLCCFTELQAIVLAGGSWYSHFLQVLNI